MKRMKLCLLILTLQLAQIASAEVGPVHSENAGLRRRQTPGVTSSNLEARQVQEGGTSRVSKSRAWLDSRLPEEEDRKEEGNPISNKRIARRRGVRNGGKVRKGSAGLLKNQILNRFVISEPIGVDKEVRRSGHGQGRRVAKRRKGISNIRDPIGSEQDKIIRVQQTPDDETLKVKHIIGLSHRISTLIEDAEQKEMHIDKTTTVNPVLIWRQQAAVTEKGAPRSGADLSRRTGMAGERRRNIKRRKGGRKTEKINTKQTSLEDNKASYSDDSKIAFPARIKSSQVQLQGKDSLKERLDFKGKERTTTSKDFRAAHGSFVHNNPNESKEQSEKDKTSGRPALNLRHKIETTFSRESFHQKSDTTHRFSSERRFGHLRHNLSNKQHEVSKSKETGSTENAYNERRKPIRTNSINSLSTSITKESTPVSDSLRNYVKIKANVNKAESNKIYPRRRGSFTPRKNHENKEPFPSSRENETSGRKINQRLRSKVDPRNRNGEKNLQTDSQKVPVVSLNTDQSKRRQDNTLQSKKKVQTLSSNLSPRNNNTNLVNMSDEIKISDEKQLQTDFAKVYNYNTVQIGDAAGLVENEEVEQLNEDKTVLLKEKNEAALNGNLNKRYRFKPESRKVANVLLFHKEIIEKKGIQTSRKTGNPDIGRSKSLLNEKVDQRLKERFDPRRRNVEQMSDKESKDKHVRTSIKQDKSITAKTTKDSHDETEKHLATNESKSSKKLDNETIVENKTNQLGNKNTERVTKKKGKLSTSRRRGQIPQNKKNDPEYPLRKKQDSIRARRVNHRFRQTFDTRSKHASNDDITKDERVVSVKPFVRARNIQVKQTYVPKPSTVHAASDRYFEIAFKHAQVTWAQDPFRKDSEVVDGPQFDIDYTKDPNFNSDDNKGSVDRFSNFAKEEESLSTKESQQAQTQEARSRNNVPGGFSFVPNIERSRQRQFQVTNKDRNNSEDSEAVSSGNIGSFSAPAPVFVPLFVPDLRKHEQEEKSPLFEPFSFSVNLGR